MVELEEKIKTWLKKQGYSLEMQVANAFRRYGLDATLANYYDDPNSGNSRQIDVIATAEDFIGYHRVEFVVECKLSNDKPWILLSSEGSSDGYNPLFEYALTSPEARRGIVESDDTQMQSLELPWMKYHGSSGVGLVTAFSEQKDIAFDAVRGAMAAAISRRAELLKDTVYPAVFIFPVVVFKNRLFECNLCETDELHVKEIEEAKLYFPMSFGSQSGTCVYITTASNLEKFVVDAVSAVKALDIFLRPKAKEWLEEQ